MPATQSPEFTKAVEDSRKLKAKPTDNELLELYAYFKEGTQDPPIKSAPSPGMFDLKGKAKKSAWQKVADLNLTPEEAQKKYVELIEAHKKAYGYDENATSA